ncbi:MAG: hypothetical protein NTY15_19740 [Planctomycetota bacterium]|nr:hypothetical protein [Planctomycetota bacterium]
MHYLSSALAVILLSAMLTISWWSAKADQPESDGAAANSVQNESVDVRLARAHIELAKMDLRRAQEANERIRIYSVEFIEKLQLHVAIDEAELEQCLKGEDYDSHKVCVRSAEASLKVAEADLRGARAAYQPMPTADSALAAERAGMVVELAKLNLERAKGLSNSESVLTHLQWQIDELRHQVLELQMRR